MADSRLVFSLIEPNWPLPYSTVQAYSTVPVLGLRDARPAGRATYCSTVYARVKTIHSSYLPIINLWYVDNLVDAVTKNIFILYWYVPYIRTCFFTSLFLMNYVSWSDFQSTLFGIQSKFMTLILSVIQSQCFSVARFMNHSWGWRQWAGKGEDLIIGSTP